MLNRKGAVACPLVAAEVFPAHPSQPVQAWHKNGVDMALASLGPPEQVQGRLHGFHSLQLT